MAGVVHFEIPTGDKERANTFYQSAFGCTLLPMQGMDYTSAITTPSDEQTGMPSAPGPSTVAQAKDAVPGMGWYAYFKDTEVNIMGLWQTDSSAGS
ncbi:VOC family protein [Pseudarthrobacter sp. AL07]|uniref:VOC family protein n=1 Tax=unclassified Pseudarthrobacter TaxID=2647000 RepID=UPI00249B2F42|nr:MULTISPECIES: VOC family protein [unclassified Pseudarthrobacter]MDI3193639.1 VOC family protein [Pseudarthrobacter sp. AL20]MDI3207851.1 VOC family protein [Pseudarthrobacter sp. AL07]